MQLRHTGASDVLLLARRLSPAACSRSCKIFLIDRLPLSTSLDFAQQRLTASVRLPALDLFPDSTGSRSCALAQPLCLCSALDWTRTRDRSQSSRIVSTRRNNMFRFLSTALITAERRREDCPVDGRLFSLPSSLVPSCTQPPSPLIDLTLEPPQRLGISLHDAATVRGLGLDANEDPAMEGKDGG